MATSKNYFWQLLKIIFGRLLKSIFGQLLNFIFGQTFAQNSWATFAVGDVGLRLFHDQSVISRFEKVDLNGGGFKETQSGSKVDQDKHFRTFEISGDYKLKLWNKIF